MRDNLIEYPSAQKWRNMTPDQQAEFKSKVKDWPSFEIEMEKHWPVKSNVPRETKFIQKRVRNAR